jgi:ACS family hexuronate transporter-like MFS transporter
VRRLSLWVPAATMLAVSLISYIDRNTLALLAPTILKETGLTAEKYGLVISAFSVAYMLSNPLWGRWLDRFGVRLGMILAVVVWSGASASHALAAGFLSFALARATLGFGEGATFPGGLRVVMQTMPPALRARGVAVAYSGGSLGSVITPLLITPVALAWGWRAAFLCTGAVGLGWLMLWLLVSRRDDIRRCEPPAAGPVTDKPRFTDPRLWGYMLAYALGALPLALVIYVAALYLNRVLGASQGLIGQVLWIPPLGWETGYFFWGWLSDRLPGERKVAGLGRLMGVTAALSLLLALAPWHRSIALVMVQMFVAMFLAGGFIILTVSYATHVYSTAHSGLLAGLGAGAWSAAVAVVMPLFGRLIDRGRWDAAFLLAAMVPLAGYLLWRVLNRPEPVRPAPCRSVRSSPT